MRNKFYLILPLLLLLTVRSGAQNMPGINTSNWGGVSNVSWNPAIADSHYKFDMSLGDLNLTLNNNLVGLGAPGLFNQIVPLKEFVSYDFVSDHFFQNYDNRVKSIAVNSAPRNFDKSLTAQGPLSFMVSFGKGNENAIAISYHFNMVKNFDNLDDPFARFMGFQGVASFNNNASQLFRVVTMEWFDYDITYSRVILNKEKHFLKFGITAKILQSVGATYINATDFTYSIANSDNISINSGNISYMSQSSTSISAGGDFGLVYEFRPYKHKYDYDMDGETAISPKFKDLHTLAIGFSVIDAGALFFKNPDAASSFSLNNQSYSLSNLPIGSTASLNNYISNNYNSTYTGPTKIILPTRFNLFADYNIDKGLGINLATTISPVMASQGNQIHYNSMLQFTPRFDLPLFGAYLPFTYNFGGQPMLGAGFRFGPLWVGLSDFLAFALPKGMYGNTFYVGLKIPIIYKKPKDRDHDLVSDKFDLCPFEKGTWATKGCPDRDGDGIADKDDKCPDVPGLPQFDGCPDTDGDGITDAEDSCPLVPGIAKFHGCPDTDNDGVEDRFDDCPVDSGSVNAFGCPDSDADGVPDIDVKYPERIDKCPQAKGLLEHHGCPDTDGDKVFDDEDDCVYIPGPRENHGCPWGDQDGDGIPDNEDSCPLVPGVREYHGCPSPPKADRIKDMQVAWPDTIQFELNQIIIGQVFQQKLKKFAAKMTVGDQKDNSIYLIGHTDDTEGPDKVTKEGLSIRRAEAVKKFLTEQGITEDRIMVFGYGDTAPVVNNDSPLRWKNRRVDIIMVIVPH